MSSFFGGGGQQEAPSVDPLFAGMLAINEDE